MPLTEREARRAGLLPKQHTRAPRQTPPERPQRTTRGLVEERDTPPRSAPQKPSEARDMSPERFDAQHPGWNCRWNDAGYAARQWVTGRLVGPCATRTALSRELEADNGGETDG